MEIRKLRKKFLGQPMSYNLHTPRIEFQLYTIFVSHSTRKPQIYNYLKIIYMNNNYRYPYKFDWFQYLVFKY
ncbi:hypothetical protein WN51_03433 [Melipona quadrifasciata]|uniref:Uncharacterized protein n=1 Tax=Melipona quadrifasciata TaxID=166423 RepID=A0A0M9ABH6_9HYME|nr:hypothetical protein WN51_03433 [Melipona quadrifasciata]